MKKLLTLILTAALIFALGAPAFAAGEDAADTGAEPVQLTDVFPGSWYYEPVTDMVASGVVTGYEDGSFQPDRTVTVVEAVTMAARITGAPSGELDGFWGGQQLDHAYRSGWISEDHVPRGEFNMPATRELACKIIAGAFGLGYPAETVLPFTDSASVGEAYEGSVLALYAHGLLTGFTDGTLRPQGTLTRAEAAALLYRADHIGEDMPDLPEPPADYYITADGYTADEILAHFAVTALEAEYGVTEKPVTRWTEPVSYYIDTAGASAGDLECLQRLMAAINEIPGFPGYYPAAGEGEADLRIHFVSAEEINRVGGAGDGYQFNGYVSFSWDGDCSITSSDIYYNYELAEEARPAVIAEELCQGLGLLQDVYDQPESIFYQYHYQHYFTASWPSTLDWAVMRLLYSDVIRPGMSGSEALAAASAIVR